MQLCGEGSAIMLYVALSVQLKIVINSRGETESIFSTSHLRLCRAQG